MGTGASAGVQAALTAASDDDIKSALASISSEERAKLGVALGKAGAGGAGPKPFAKLIFSRHGESEWNVANKFTGWVDVDLSEKGVTEAKGAGTLLKEEGIMLDIAFTSYLKRAIKTLDLALETADQLYVPVKKTWRLNERMYGGLQGLDKKETVQKHGADQVQIWRRSFDLPPPDIEKDNACYTGKEEKYKDLKPEEIPVTESLKDVIARVMPYWKESIETELKQGKTVFVAAHGNSIRAIVKDIESIPDDVIPGLEIPTATPLVYELDSDLKPIANSLAVAPLKFGRYLGDAEKIKAAAEAVKNQTKV
jgi:2,3-bisphosphoglycerate-dependent phosphoglycerate mutase